jgi:hypothetical protein
MNSHIALISVLDFESLTKYSNGAPVNILKKVAVDPLSSFLYDPYALANDFYNKMNQICLFLEEENTILFDCVGI